MIPCLFFFPFSVLPPLLLTPFTIIDAETKTAETAQRKFPRETQEALSHPRPAQSERKWSCEH
jgi:hypothetical protein